MSLSISPQVRLLAAIGLLAAAGLGGAMFFLSRAQAPSDVVPASAVATKSVATPTPAQKRATRPPKPAAKKPAARPKPVRPAPARPSQPKAGKPVVNANGLPAAIAVALQRHRVVVVSLFAPDAAVDRLALQESQAGAKDARAGFVALNVLSQAQAGPLNARLGVLEAPAVLVYRRPGTIVLHLEGFADRETVAQAAMNAATGAA